MYFLPIKIVVSSDFCTLSYHFFCAQLSGNFLKITFSKRMQKLGFSIFSVLILDFENSLFGVCENTIKIGVSAILCVLLLKEKKISKKVIAGISGFC